LCPASEKKKISQKITFGGGEGTEKLRNFKPASEPTGFFLPTYMVSSQLQELTNLWIFMSLHFESLDINWVIL
jgi:hypothetical protein